MSDLFYVSYFETCEIDRADFDKWGIVPETICGLRFRDNLIITLGNVLFIYDYLGRSKFAKCYFATEKQIKIDVIRILVKEAANLLL